jgi:hypothetical protein
VAPGTAASVTVGVDVASVELVEETLGACGWASAIWLTRAIGEVRC